MSTFLPTLEPGIKNKYPSKLELRWYFFKESIRFKYEVKKHAIIDKATKEIKFDDNLLDIRRRWN